MKNNSDRLLYGVKTRKRYNGIGREMNLLKQVVYKRSVSCQKNTNVYRKNVNLKIKKLIIQIRNKYKAIDNLKFRKILGNVESTKMIKVAVILKEIK